MSTRIQKVVLMGLCCFIVVSVGADEGECPEGCVCIEDGTLLYSSGHYLGGQPLQVGFDPYGYNYQGHMFDGSYANAYLGRPGAAFPPYPYKGTDQDKADYVAANEGVTDHWAWPYRDDRVKMKWNDAWLSNMDCDEDGVLDRHYGYDSYSGSGAWLTNHIRWMDEDGKKWEYFTKIVAPPDDAVKEDGVWYTANGKEIGPAIWGAFAQTQEVEGGLQYGSPAGPGVGKWDPEAEE